MPGPSLVHRRSQFALLAEACRRRAPARLVVRGDDTWQRGHQAHLAGLETDRILLAIPHDSSMKYVPGSAPVDVFFRHGGQPYAFSAHIRSLRSRRRDARTACPVLQLSLPLCVERRQRRAYRRAPLAADRSISARLTNMSGGRPPLTMRLTNYSHGGFGGTVAADVAEHLHAGEFYLAEFDLPEQTSGPGCVVRLVHCSGAPAPGPAAVGWSFCAGDDPALHGETLVRIERYNRAARPGAVRTADAPSRARR